MKDKMYWKQANGKIISIDDMDINHLRNVLKMLIKNSKKVQSSTKFKLNGEAAKEFNETYIEDIYGMEMEAGITDYEQAVGIFRRMFNLKINIK